MNCVFLGLFDPIPFATVTFPLSIARDAELYLIMWAALSCARTSQRQL